MISSLTVPLLDFARSLIKRELAYINVESDEFASSSLVLGAFDRQRPPEASKKKSGALRSKAQGGLFKKGEQPVVVDAAGKERITIGHIPRMLQLEEPGTSNQEARERAQISMIKSLTQHYFTLVKKTIADALPKAVMYLLVNKVQDEMQKELLTQLYSDYTFKTLMSESEKTRATRERATEMLAQLEQAMKVMDEVKDLD